MSGDSSSAYVATALRYGLIGGAVLAYVIVYIGLFVGGWYVLFRVMAVLDAAVIQPLVGGNELVSFVIFGVVQLGYIVAVYRIGAPGAAMLAKKSSPHVLFSKVPDDDGHP